MNIITNNRLQNYLESLIRKIYYMALNEAQKCEDNYMAWNVLCRLATKILEDGIRIGVVPMENRDKMADLFIKVGETIKIDADFLGERISEDCDPQLLDHLARREYSDSEKIRDGRDNYGLKENQTLKPCVIEIEAIDEDNDGNKIYHLIAYEQYILDEEILMQIGTDRREIIEMYFQETGKKGLSQTIELFKAYLDLNGYDLEDVYFEDVRQGVDYLDNFLN